MEPTYEIIYTQALPADCSVDPEIKGGIAVVARVGCAEGLSVYPAALTEMAPTGVDITIELILHDDAGGVMTAGFSDIVESVLVRVSVRHDSSDTAKVIVDRYLALLDRFLNIPPHRTERYVDVYDVLAEWNAEIA